MKCTLKTEIQQPEPFKGLWIFVHAAPINYPHYFLDEENRDQNVITFLNVYFPDQKYQRNILLHFNKVKLFLNGFGFVSHHHKDELKNNLS